MNENEFKSIYIDYLNGSVDVSQIKHLVESYIKDMRDQQVNINPRSMVESMDLTHIATEIAMDHYAQKYNLAMIIKTNGERIIL